MAKKTTTKQAVYKMKDLKACPFCGGELVHRYSGLKDRLNTTKKTFSFSDCTECKTGMLNPTIVGDASEFYPVNYLSEGQASEQASSEANGGFDLEKWYRYNQYRFDFGLLTKATGLTLQSADSYVDIGCGSGERVTFALEQGCKNPLGVDKFDFAKNVSKAEIKIVNSDILKFKPSKKIKVASLFHVMEHLENPREILSHIRTDILKKDGYLIVQIPNYGSFESRLFKSRWFSLDVPRHLWQYNARSATKLLEDCGYKIDGVFQRGAPLHPVTIVPSINKELDVQRIWVNQNSSVSYKRLLMLVWAGMTILTIPFSLLQNLFRRSSMLTVIASSK